jgi:hypothetical protein
VILFTDGKSSDEKKTYEAANQFKIIKGVSVNHCLFTSIGIG